MSKISFNEAFNDYYKLKNKYEKILKRESEKITNSGNSNKKEKYENAKICVRCKQKGGTIFSQKGNTLIAKCNATKPCSLNIHLERAINKNITNELNDTYNNIIREKQQTILTKLDYLFTIVDSETTKINFTKFKSSFVELTKKYQNYLNFYNNLINNKEDKLRLKELNSDLLDNIDTIKSNITEFNKTNNLELVKESVETYINSVVPLVKRIQNISYPLNYIYIDDDNVNYLIQNKYNFSDLDINIDNTENKVISFNL